MTPLPTEELVNTWTELRAMIPISSIQNEEQYDRVVEALDQLLDLVGDDETHPLYSLLDTLGTLISDYEEKHYPEPSVSGIETLKFLMEEHELTPTDLPELGDASAVSELLDGKRELSVGEIRALSKRFGLSPATFFDDD